MRPTAASATLEPNAPEEVLNAVGHLATCLETPQVPGELEHWMATVRQAADGAGQLLRRRLATVHKTDYAEIAAADPGLLHRVEQMKTEDARSLELLDALGKRIEVLDDKVRRVEPNELAIADELQGLVDQGLAFVIQVQKQEVARRTWLQEAFNRDRGVVD
jgi:hypothetical protein